MTLSNGGTFRISSVLASGTRVTATPTKLGEYRSQLRDAGAVTFTDTNGTPTAVPSSANGIRIYNGNTYASADTSNEPTRYEIFIGRNKHFRAEYYSATARTGFANVGPLVISTVDVGYVTNYDPTTGVFLISASRSVTTHESAMSNDGRTTINDIYFDVIVSENALAVESDVDRKEKIRVTAITTTETLTQDGTTLYKVTSAGGAYTITLPTAVGLSGRYLTFKKTSSDINLITLDGFASETIDGSATYAKLCLLNDMVKLVSDNSNWIIVEEKLDIGFAHCSGGNTLSTGAGVVIDWSTENSDVHGLVTVGAAWKYKCPRAGKLYMKFMLTDTISVVDGSYVYVTQQLNGSEDFDSLGYTEYSTTDAATVCILRDSLTKTVTVGQEINFTLHTSGLTFQMDTDGTRNHIMMYYVD